MERRNRFFLACGIFMLAAELWKQWSLTFVINQGNYDWWYFPFQLCSIPLYLTLLIPWIKHPRIRKLLFTFLMDFGLLGGIFAFFDTSGMQYPMLSLTIVSITWHILLITIGIAAGLSGEGDTSWRGWFCSVLCYAAACIIATILNITLAKYGTINMFYISPYSKMRQVIFKDIAFIIGNTPGIFLYIGTTILGSGIFHGLWRIIKRKNTNC